MTSVELFDTNYTQEIKIKELSTELNEPEWLYQRRLQAYENYSSLPLDKDTLFYKYTSFRNFDPKSLSFGSNATMKTGEETATVTEWENGIISEIPDSLTSKGVFFGSIHSLISQNETLAKKIISKVDETSAGFDKLGELGKAFSRNILILYVPRGVIIEDVLHRKVSILNEQAAMFSECIIYLEEGSSVKVLEALNSNETENERLFVGSQTLILEDNARLVISHIQNWDSRMVHTVARDANLSRFSNLRSLTHMQGGYLIRHNSNVDLIGDGSEGYDLFVKFGINKQRFDVKSELHHIGRDTIGNVHARTVMMDRAESILRGLIVISETGVNTDSWLTSQGMTVGKGKVVAIPALNIDQNDVKAAHAASVEPLQEDLVFYLTTRGVSYEEARELLVKGYFEYILNQIGDEKLQSISREMLASKWDEVEKK